MALRKNGYFVICGALFLSLSGCMGNGGRGIVGEVDAAPGYEVLKTPRPASLYTPGRSWTVGVGPTGPALGNVLTGAGAGELSASEKAAVQAQASGSVTRWITGALGLSAASIDSVRFGKLTQSQVEDIYATGARGAVLYETIIAEEVEINFASDLAATLGARPPAISGMELSVAGAGGDRYAVRGQDGSPLVVAIKVVRLDYGRSRSEKGVLRAGRVGESMPIGLGYTATLTGRPDPSAGTTPVRFSNPEIAQWPGAAVTMSLTEPWLNPVRFSTEGDEGELIWDSIAMSWSGPSIVFTVTRQSLKIEPMRSGL